VTALCSSVQVADRQAERRLADSADSKVCGSDTSWGPRQPVAVWLRY
jgi:hypothetical protein